MSLLLNVISAGHARGTHHKLILDSLRHLRGTAAAWVDLLLSQHAALLEGAKAPDDDFRDFRNHVLHVSENFWGGAQDSAEFWYGQLVDHLRGQEWKEAAYAAGVLSHYYSDPLMPFHTGQSEAEGAVHRAAEWSVSKSYETLRSLIEEELGGYPEVDVPSGDTWLRGMVRAGATKANAHYELLIDHYSLELGVKNPPAGLDRVCQEALAHCLAHATIGISRILERAFLESAAEPPVVGLTLQSVLATVNTPVRQLLNRLADARDRKIVEAIYQEVQETGKAIHSLPDSERLVRQFHAAEVRKVSLRVLDAEKTRPAGQMYGKPAAVPIPSPVTSPEKTHLERHKLRVIQKAEVHPATSEEAGTAGRTAEVELSPVKPAILAAVAGKISSGNSDNTPFIRKTAETDPPSRRIRLRMEDPIVDAPSIGPKTAARFQQIGLHTVGDLLQADPITTAAALKTRHITQDVLRDWQSQAALMTEIAGLRGLDAQLLVTAGIRTAPQLASVDAESLLKTINRVVESSEGKRILRDGRRPDIADVTTWSTSLRLKHSPRLVSHTE